MKNSTPNRAKKFISTMTVLMETDRIRKMRSGMIGLARRDSRTKKTTSRSSDAPPNPRVWADCQPYGVAVEMA